MTYKVRAGAPFDKDNIFNIPATEGGTILKPAKTIDAGTFASPKIVNIDGGYIPILGTATYNPNRTYGPNDIVNN